MGPGGRRKSTSASAKPKMGIGPTCTPKFHLPTCTPCREPKRRLFRASRAPDSKSTLPFLDLMSRSAKIAKEVACEIMGKLEDLVEKNQISGEAFRVLCEPLPVLFAGKKRPAESSDSDDDLVSPDSGPTSLHVRVRRPPESQSPYTPPRIPTGHGPPGTSRRWVFNPYIQEWHLVQESLYTPSFMTVVMAVNAQGTRSEFSQNVEGLPENWSTSVDFNASFLSRSPLNVYPSGPLARTVGSDGTAVIHYEYNPDVGKEAVVAKRMRFADGPMTTGVNPPTDANAYAGSMSRVELTMFEHASLTRFETSFENPVYRLHGTRLLSYGLFVEDPDFPSHEEYDVSEGQSPVFYLTNAYAGIPGHERLVFSVETRFPNSCCFYRGSRGQEVLRLKTVTLPRYGEDDVADWRSNSSDGLPEMREREPYENVENRDFHFSKVYTHYAAPGDVGLTVGGGSYLQMKFQVLETTCPVKIASADARAVYDSLCDSEADDFDSYFDYDETKTMIAERYEKEMEDLCKNYSLQKHIEMAGERVVIISRRNTDPLFSFDSTIFEVWRNEPVLVDPEKRMFCTPRTNATCKGLMRQRRVCLSVGVDALYQEVMLPIEDKSDKPKNSVSTNFSLASSRIIFMRNADRAEAAAHAPVFPTRVEEVVRLFNKIDPAAAEAVSKVDWNACADNERLVGSISVFRRSSVSDWCAFCAATRRSNPGSPSFNDAKRALTPPVTAFVSTANCAKAAESSANVVHYLASTVVSKTRAESLDKWAKTAVPSLLLHAKLWQAGEMYAEGVLPFKSSVYV